MTEPAIWYFDVISPFAYLGLRDVEEMAKTGQHIVYRPILLGALLRHWGHLGPAEIPPKRIHTYRMCVWEAQTRGIPFRMPPAHPFNPLRMLRLLCALDATPAAVRSAMDLIWRDGLDGAAEPTVADLGGMFGVDDVDGLIDRTGAKDSLRRNTEEAISHGLFGVPTLLIGGELFWGLDAMPMASAFLAEPAMFSTGEMARLRTVDEGIFRQR